MGKKLCLTVQQYDYFKKVCYPWMIDYAHFNDPTWGVNGSENHYVVYLKDELSLSSLLAMCFYNQNK